MQSFRALFLVALSCASLASGSPVEKVVKLLTGMQANLKADGAAEKAMFEKFSCWCTGMTSKKGAAIDQAKKDLKALGTDILRLRGEISKHSSDINDAANDMKTNHEDQQTATKARDLENAAFTALRGEMGQALQSLGQALKMLNMAPQFLQTKSGLSAEQATAVRSAIDAIPEHALGSLPVAKISQLQHISASVAKGEYNPSYGSLVTILEGMNDQFKADLKAETKTEETSKDNFASLMVTKVKELNALQDTVDKREGQKATAASDLATATQDYDDTEAQMTSDIAFFTDAVDSCENKATAWTTRQKMRAEELKGVQEAITILTSDEARALFSSAISAEGRVARAKNAGDRLAATIDFLQVEGATMLPAQQAAFKVLKTLSSKTQNMVLAKIAAQVKVATGGHFTEVMKAIDSVIGVLKTEQDDDNKKKVQCNEEYKKIASTSADLDWKIEKNEAKIDTLESTIASKQGELKETQKAISDVKQEVIDMVAQRKAEKEAYDSAKKEDEDAVKLLKQAKTALEAFAKNNDIKGATAFFQGSAPDDVLRGDSAPKAKFSDKGSRNQQTKGISTLLQTIVEGLEDEIRVQTIVENQGKADMAKAKKAAEDLQSALETKETNLDKAIADRNTDKDDENGLMTNNKKDLKSEQDYNTKIKPDCEFTINNWQSRFNQRKAEMDGLVTAKDFLAGAMSLSQAKKHSF